MGRKATSRRRSSVTKKVAKKKVARSKSAPPKRRKPSAKARAPIDATAVNRALADRVHIDGLFGQVLADEEERQTHLRGRQPGEDRPHPVTKLTAHARDRFIVELRAHGNISAAARSIGFTRQAAYRLRKQNEAFAEQWDEAVNGYLDELESVVADRGLNGTLKPIVYQGEITGYVREFDTNAALATLRAKRRTVWGEKMDVTSGDEPLAASVQTVNYASVPAAKRGVPTG